MVPQHQELISLEKDQSTPDVLAEFFGFVQDQFREGHICEDVHYKIKDEKIVLRFQSLYSMYARHCRHNLHKNPPDRDTLKTELALFEGVPIYEVDKFFIATRFTAGLEELDMLPKAKRVYFGCCSMNYQKLHDAYSLDIKPLETK